MYAQSTMEHIRLVGKQRISQVEGYTPNALDNQVATAEKARQSARGDIRQYEAAAHPETAERLDHVPEI